MVGTNIFQNPAFSLAEMTDSIIRLPYNIYSLTDELGIFGDERGVTTRTIQVEERGGSLNLLPSVVPGGPPTLNHSAKRKMKAFVIPRIPLDDVVLPDDVAGIRDFDTESFMTVMSLMTEKLQEMRNKLDITKEWLRMGALKGVLYDGDGTTVLYNFYTEFGITPYVVNFNFSSSTFDVLGTSMNVKRHMEDFLHGDFMTNVMCLCSPEFFDALVSHPQVRDAFKFYQRAAYQLGNDARMGFEYGGVTYREYRGNATDLTGTTRKFIAAGEAQFFPLGTRTTFRLYNAPANFNETINKPGLPYYAKQEPRKFNEGIDIRTEANPFPICRRPELLVRATIS